MVCAPQKPTSLWLITGEVIPSDVCSKQFWANENSAGFVLFCQSQQTKDTIWLFNILIGKPLFTIY